MVKHIVFWRFHDEADGRAKEENLQIAKKMIEGMQGKIPGLIKVEAGINFSQSPNAYDLALYSEIESPKALEVYRVHPEHAKVKDFLADVRYEVGAVDYEV
jgi:hypothetical protein